MAYRLWLESYQDVFTYYRKKQGKYYLPCKECEPLKFRTKDKVKQDFSIKEIDSLTCSYSCEEDFLKELRKYRSYNFQKDGSEHLLLTYQNRSGNMKQGQILYHNQLLRDCAITSRNEKNLKPTEKLYEFIEYIKNLALNKTTSPYLLSPEKIEGLSLEEKIALRDCLPKDLPYGEDKIKRGLISYLKSYQSLLEDYENLDSTLEVDRELMFLNQRIYACFLESYQTLRKMMVWEELYKKILKRQLSDTKNNVEEMVLTSQLAQVEIEQNYRNSSEDRRSEIEIISFEEAEAQFFLKDEHTSRIMRHENISDDMLSYLEYGGVDEVMAQMSADDIYGNLDVAKSLGIVPKNYQIKKSNH